MGNQECSVQLSQQDRNHEPGCVSAQPEATVLGQQQTPALRWPAVFGASPAGGALPMEESPRKIAGRSKAALPKLVLGDGTQQPPPRQQRAPRQQPTPRLQEVSSTSGSTERPVSPTSGFSAPPVLAIVSDQRPSSTITPSNLPKTYFHVELGEGPLAESEGRERHEYTFRTGATYQGQWLRGSRDGVGRQSWPDGTEYTGQWHRGFAHGMGMMVHGDGDHYIGQWVNGRAHGMGTYYFLSANKGSEQADAVFRGTFSYDLKEGPGEELWAEGSSYRGEFCQSEKHGYGVNEWPEDPDGDIRNRYEGHWQHNELHGPGMLDAEGFAYHGQWRSSRPSGQGRYRWRDGRLYEGGYQNDRKHGFGIYYNDTGETIFKGFWVNGVQEGSDD